MITWRLVQYSSIEKELKACVSGAGNKEVLRSNFLVSLRELQRHGTDCLRIHPGKYKRIEGTDLYRAVIEKGKKNIRLIYGALGNDLVILLLVVFEEDDKGDYKKAIRTASDRFRTLTRDYYLKEMSET